MVMYAKIRRMHFREHLTISEIQRRISLSRNTIKKWLREDKEPHYQRRRRDTKLTPFEPRLKLAMETDAHRPKRDRRTAKMLYEAILKDGYTGARRRIWIDAKAQRFGSFGELNVWLEARCRALWTEIQHPDYAGITVADALEQEQMYLMPMPTPFDGYVEILARVSSTCLVTVQRNRYSVPCHLANHRVAIHLYPDRIEVSSENAIIACHTRLIERDQVSYNWQHYIPLIAKKPGALRNGAPFADMPLPFARLQAALRRREWQQGDRIMAKVLAAIPAHGLEAVLVAVELVLESGVPSVEHVLNVLARLNQTPPPAQVETSLKLTEEPLADTSRYDSLNTQEIHHV
jgi:transposase-like protein